MNWDAIGAIGQVLGSVAVFATLGYLTVQIRHAREQMSRTVGCSTLRRQPIGAGWVIS